jgi:hypothetical protein
VGRDLKATDGEALGIQAALLHGLLTIFLDETFGKLIQINQNKNSFRILFCIFDEYV